MSMQRTQQQNMLQEVQNTKSIIVPSKYAKTYKN